MTGTRYGKPRRGLVIALSAVVFVMFGLCIGLMAALFVFIRSEIKEVERPVDAFMVAMANNDADGAYALIASSARKSMEIAEIWAMLEGREFAKFKGYRSVSGTGLSTTSQKGPADSGSQTVSVAEIYGEIYYDGGYKGTFVAGAEMEDNEWKLVGINVTIPPEKYGK